MGRFQGAMAVAAALLAGGEPVRAQEEPPDMEAQRCVWACLYNSPGAESAEYNACVTEYCVAQYPEVLADPTPPAAPAFGAWTVTPTAQGGGTSIGATDPATGVSVHLLCMADGRRLIALFGLEGPAARMSVVAGGRLHALDFAPHAGGHYADVPRGSALLSDLVQTGVLVVLNQSGWVQAQIGTTPAHPAIRSACP